MPQNKTKTPEKLFLEFQQNDLKVEIDEYMLNTETGGAGNIGMTGTIKIKSVRAAVDQKNTKLLLNLIAKSSNYRSFYDGHFPEVSILKNSKKVGDMLRCMVSVISGDPAKYPDDKKNKFNYVNIYFQDGTFYF